MIQVLQGSDLRGHQRHVCLSDHTVVIPVDAQISGGIVGLQSSHIVTVRGMVPHGGVLGREKHPGLPGRKRIERGAALIGVERIGKPVGIVVDRNRRFIVGLIGALPAIHRDGGNKIPEGGADSRHGFSEQADIRSGVELDTEELNEMAVGAVIDAVDPSVIGLHGRIHAARHHTTDIAVR